MGQQPNIEHTEADLPRKKLEPPPPMRWRPTKPGLVLSPEDQPRGATFATVGPDSGWALRLLGRADLPDDDPRLKGLLGGLMMARAAALGRGPVIEDLEAALILCGYFADAKPEAVARRERWLGAVPHEQRPGALAVAETDRDLLSAKPGQIHWAMGHRPGAKEPPRRTEQPD